MRKINVKNSTEVFSMTISMGTHDQIWIQSTNIPKINYTFTTMPFKHRTDMELKNFVIKPRESLKQCNFSLNLGQAEIQDLVC